MTDPENTRQFQRLALSEEAVAVDDRGVELGRVSNASGGGFRIFPASKAALSELKPGRRMRITIVEPKGQAKNTLDVEVRHMEGDAVGLMFVGSETR